MSDEADEVPGGSTAGGSGDARPMGGVLSGAEDYTAVNPGGTSVEPEGADEQDDEASPDV